MTLTTTQQQQSTSPQQPFAQLTVQSTTVGTLGCWIWWGLKMYFSFRLFFLPHLFSYCWQYSIELAKENAKWDVNVTISLDGRVKTMKRTHRETGQVVSVEELVEDVQKNVRRVIAKRVVKQEAVVKHVNEAREAVAKRVNEQREAVAKRVNAQREAVAKRVNEQRAAVAKRVNTQREAVAKRVNEQREAVAKRVNAQRDAVTKSVKCHDVERKQKAAQCW
jgi:hypothetical protein